ncbi:MAG TPA: hemolysin family protein [Kiloniellales bacterium]
MSETGGQRAVLGAMADNGGQRNGGRGGAGRFWQWLRQLLGFKGAESSLRHTLEEIIEEIGEGESEDEANGRISEDEKAMLANILRQRHQTAYDIMVPRADIVAVDVRTDLESLVQIMSKAGHSRVPVYRDTLDDALGLVHIKDLVPYVGGKGNFDLASTLREALFVAPSMPVLDLLLEMRQSRVHMALVVDEFGGIDGLITIEDLVEEIVGEIEDEYDVSEGPKLVLSRDGSLVADSRATVEDFEELVGPVLSDEERQNDIDTLGGLVFSLAGRVPTRGELVLHPHSGISFEVMEADPRRIRRLRIRNFPATTTTQNAAADAC